MENHRLMVEHEEHFDFQVPAKVYNPTWFDYARVLHCGHHEPPLLERPLKAQGLAVGEVVEHIHCGLGHKEMYASMDWVDRYMIDIGML